MTKKVLCALLAILAVVSLSAGIGYGLAWYQSNHVTVGGHSYYIYEEELDLTGRDLTIAEYEQLQALLPECTITWSVPFQGSKYSSNSAALKVSTFTQADMDLVLTYFPGLTSLDATGCKDYAVLRDFQAAKEDCTVVYQVDLGGKEVQLDGTSLTLENGDYVFETLTENLQYLPKLTELTLRKPALTLAQIDELKARYSDISILCTVEILGKEYDTETTQLDLSHMEAAQVEAMAEKLSMLPKLESVELMAADGTAKLTTEEVKKLVNMAPNTSFHYEFEFYGQKLSSDMEEVELVNLKINKKELEKAETELRTALDLMPKCKRIVLDNCGFSDEVLAKLREDYRDRTKVVWRIKFGSHGSCLTDVEIFRCVGSLEKNYKAVQYCEDVVFMDVGHCERLKTIEFVEKMPKLKILIASGSEIKDLSPLKNCKELEFLELGFCGYVEDLTPLKDLTNLRMLNIADTKVEDLKPLDDLNLMYFVGLRSTGKSRVSVEEQERFMAQHPACATKFDGKQPYGIGWRYEEDNSTFTPYYNLLSIVFRYKMYGKESQQFGRYLADVDPYIKKEIDANGSLEALLKAVEEEVAQWEKKAEEAKKEAAEDKDDTKADEKSDAKDTKSKTTAKDETPKETTGETVPETIPATEATEASENTEE